MNRLSLGLCVVLLAASLPSSGKETKIHGFVTAVTSPTSFEIDEYKITKDVTLALEIERDDSGDATAVFTPEDIRVGTELEIKGDYDPSTNELKAKSVKVFLEDTRRIKRTALLEKAPSLEKSDAGWHGMLSIDGQKVAVADSTLLTMRPNKGERKEARKDKIDVEPNGVPLTSLEGLNLDTFAHYEGVRQKDGTVLASRIDFHHAELERGEAKMWRQLSPKVKESNYLSFKPGELKVAKLKYKLVPNKQAQDYISQLGDKLVPAHQRDLPAGSDLKIPFKFYLIEDKSFNASAYPNGTVIVHSGVFDVCENEAQLAFVLSHEISHAVEKHAWQQHEYHKKALMALRIGGAVGAGFGGSAVADIANMVEAGIRNGYARSLENQADRVGMEWMLASGYDIREAPRAWKAVSLKYGDKRTNIFWDNHDNNTTRRSYLMAELRNNYSDLDYSQLQRDNENFHEIASIVQDLSAGKKKIKVKVSKNKN